MCYCFAFVWKYSNFKHDVILRQWNGKSRKMNIQVEDELFYEKHSKIYL